MQVMRHEARRGRTARNLASWMVAILLFAAPQIAVAQHRGTGGASGSKNSGNPPRDNDSDIKDFQKTFALQATEEQKAQFQSWKENTGAVKTLLQKLRAADVPSDLSSQLNGLQAAIEKSSSGYHDFVSGLTKAQQAGLKNRLHNLKKANDKLAKAAATALHELGQSKSGAKRSAELENAESAAEDLLKEQKEIAAEMSISG
jgi:uncharacterized phage infection (PIP) family protein YhgE